MSYFIETFYAITFFIRIFVFDFEKKSNYKYKLKKY